MWREAAYVHPAPGQADPQPERRSGALGFLASIARRVPSPHAVPARSALPTDGYQGLGRAAAATNPVNRGSRQEMPRPALSRRLLPLPKPNPGKAKHRREQQVTERQIRGTTWRRVRREPMYSRKHWPRAGRARSGPGSDVRGCRRIWAAKRGCCPMETFFASRPA